MQTLAGAKNNVQRPQKGSLLEVSLSDCTKWFDSQLVWPSWLVKEMYLHNSWPIVFMCQTLAPGNWFLCETTSHLKYIGCVPLGCAGSVSVIQDLSGPWCIKGTGESMARVDSPVPLMHHDPDRPWIRFTPKERSLYYFLLFSLEGRRHDAGILADSKLLDSLDQYAFKVHLTPNTIFANMQT